MIDDRVNPDESISDTSLSLLERVKANDEVAWGRLLDLYLPLVYRCCRTLKVKDADIPDVGQEVFRAVRRKIKSFRHDRAGDTFQGWLWTITQHKVADLRRQNIGHVPPEGGSDAQKAFAEIPFDRDLSDDESSTSQEIMSRALAIIAGEFPDWYAVAFLRVVIEEQRPVDVAKELGQRPSAISNAKSRILQRLRTEFRDLIDW